MWCKTKYLLILPGLFLSLAAGAQRRPANDAGITFEVTDSLKNPLQYATVALKAVPDAGKPPYAATTDAAGKCGFALPAGSYEVTVSYIGYATQRTTLTVPSGSAIYRVVRLRAVSTEIRDVVITATEVRGPVSAVHIGREAMQHLQPSSFEDLLELLPGGRASDPAFSASNHIRLREAASSDADYATSSLGVSFVMDGRPLSNDAAMQYGGSLSSGMTSDNGVPVSLNAGIDMRTLPTDEIASVEIVQGIPSVEYGDLTSGLVKIKRKEGGRNLEARFKADLKSQLLYVGKGFEWGGKADLLTMNVGANYLDARADPRNTRQNYRRMTGSWRMKKRWETASDYRYTLGGSIDYTGSFDRIKSDKDIDEGVSGRPLERYKASYNSLSAALNFSAAAKKKSAFFRSFDLSASVDADFDITDRWKYMIASANVPIRTALEEGVCDAEILPSRYEATLRVESKPFYAFAKAMALFAANTRSTRSTLRAGAEWSMAKNYGGGLLYDITRPITELMSTRPRRYDALPALHRLSAFVEDNTVIRAGKWRIEAMAGLRATAMTNLGSRYALQGKIYLDPRLNLSVSLPAFEVAGDPMRLTLSGGTGWHTKTPTLDQLFPDPVYFDYTQLNYFPEDPELRRINLIVYKYDPTNYGLLAARNFKWEVRGRAEWAGFGLSLGYFREDMTSGFRTSSRPLAFTFRDYDETAIDASALTGPPSLEGLPYEEKKRLALAGCTTNGSRTLKQGVEFTFSTPRIRPLATKLIVSGAYFRTDYENSEPQYISTSVVVTGGEPYPYIGLYDKEDSFYNELCNTNFLFDTQIPRLGMIFSTSFQCQWFTGRKRQWTDPRPASYLDTDLREHPFTDESAADGILQHMIKDDVSDIAYLYDLTPFSMYVNLKLSKRLYRDRLTVAVFVNRLFDYSPSYINVSGGRTRRYSDPYFGMEVNFKL